MSKKQNKNFTVDCKIKVRGNGDNYQLGYNENDGIFIAKTNLSNLPTDYDSVYNQLVNLNKTQIIARKEKNELTKKNRYCKQLFMSINIPVSVYLLIESFNWNCELSIIQWSKRY